VYVCWIYVIYLGAGRFKKAGIQKFNTHKKIKMAKRKLEDQPNDIALRAAKKRKVPEPSNPPKKRRRTKKDNTREVDDILSAQIKDEISDDNLEQYQEYINEKTSNIDAQYMQRSIVEKDIAQLSLVNLINSLKHRSNSALSVNCSKLDIVINRLKSYPGITRLPCFGVDSTTAEPAKCDSKGDAYAEYMENDRMVEDDEMITMLLNQMHDMAASCGLIEDITRNYSNYKYKKVDLVSYVYLKDFLRAAIPNSTERLCGEYDEKTGENKCKSFKRGGFCCREWILPSMLDQPLPDKRSPCLYCIRYKTNRLFDKTKFSKKMSAFLLQDHQVITDQPGEYCSDHCLSQKDGFFGLVGQFPCHRRNRYAEHHFGVGFDEADREIVVPGWIEKAHFFHVEPDFTYPP